MSIWLIGAGSMARDYAKVLQSMEQSFVVVGRGKLSAAFFEKETGIKVICGGVKSALRTLEAPEIAIVAVGIEQLASTATALINGGTRQILLEKPGGLNLVEIDRLNLYAQKHKADVAIAYNRRFYSSVMQARDFINADGGPLSVQFEFTEWSHFIAQMEIAMNIKERWVLGNSSHVIDLVFHLAGMPLDWHCWHKGTIDWHPASARFTGAGITQKGVLFSYLSDWQAPGRWGLEILTKKRRLILRPMEQLKTMDLGSLESELINSSDTLDVEFKPGLYQQIKAFLHSDYTLFCMLPEQVKNIQIYSQMAGYK